jgi:hypothetical protein
MSRIFDRDWRKKKDTEETKDKLKSLAAIIGNGCPEMPESLKLKLAVMLDMGFKMASRRAIQYVEEKDPMYLKTLGDELGEAVCEAYGEQSNKNVIFMIELWEKQQELDEKESMKQAVQGYMDFDKRMSQLGEDTAKNLLASKLFK